MTLLKASLLFILLSCSGISALAEPKMSDLPILFDCLEKLCAHPLKTKDPREPLELNTCYVDRAKKIVIEKEDNIDRGLYVANDNGVYFYKNDERPSVYEKIGRFQLTFPNGDVANIGLGGMKTSAGHDSFIGDPEIGSARELRKVKLSDKLVEIKDSAQLASIIASGKFQSMFIDFMKSLNWKASSDKFTKEEYDKLRSDYNDKMTACKPAAKLSSSLQLNMDDFTSKVSTISFISSGSRGSNTSATVH